MYQIILNSQFLNSKLESETGQFFWKIYDSNKRIVSPFKFKLELFEATKSAHVNNIISLSQISASQESLNLQTQFSYLMNILPCFKRRYLVLCEGNFCLFQIQVHQTLEEVVHLISQNSHFNRFELRENLTILLQLQYSFRNSVRFEREFLRCGYFFNSYDFYQLKFERRKHKTSKAIKLPE